MIIDKIENIDYYTSLGARLSLALEHLRNTDFEAKDVGSYELDSDNIIVNIHEYKTVRKEDNKFESHRKYIDVQYVVKGSELMGYVPLAEEVPLEDYNEEGDYFLYDIDGSFVQFEEGMFAVLYPEDLHMPAVGESPMPVKKVVIKVRA